MDKKNQPHYSQQKLDKEYVKLSLKYSLHHEQILDCEYSSTINMLAILNVLQRLTIKLTDRLTIENTNHFSLAGKTSAGDEAPGDSKCI